MNTERKILIADDETRMRKLVRDFLVRDGFHVIEAADGNEALERYYAEKDIALVILDVMMPGINGLEVARELREQAPALPIILLTAKSEERDELSGFEAGADEYITKPFSPRIVAARVEALLRRAYLEEEHAQLECRGIILNKAARSVTVDGKKIALSLKEFELLAFFMENKDIALSRETILNHVWNYDYFGEARTIDTHVKKLRAKLGEKGALIEAVWGIGYKFAG